MCGEKLVIMKGGDITFINNSLSWKACIVLHLVLHMKSDRNGFINTEKSESLTEKFNACQ